MPKKNDKEMVPCPYCGEEIEANAAACKYCGSDDATGWSEATYLDGIDLPEDDDYSESVERELGHILQGSPRRWFSSVPPWVALVAAILILLFGAGLLRVWL